MAIGLIGKKLGMSQLFDEEGRAIPVTLIEVGPCPILQVKTQETDGYTALQLGYEELDPSKAVGKGKRHRSGMSKPELGHAKKAGAAPHRVIREVHIDDAGEYEVGQKLIVDVFEAGEKVDVTGVSKGRGFAGNIKRHNQSRGPESHGSMYHRRPGSMGMSSDPSRVFKGKKLPGQMGNKRSTIQNLRVVKTDPENNLLFVRGAVPGHNNGYVVVKKAIKAVQKAQRKSA
jgi:large subunit ribosomal protein L3